MITQHTTIDSIEHTWVVDCMAAGEVAEWARRSPEILNRDLEGMARYFPHWLLAGATNGRPARCVHCGGLCVPARSAIRCAICSTAGQADGLTWVGHVPALQRTERPFKARLKALRKAGFAEVETAGSGYLLVPLTIIYPGEWPHLEPAVRYSKRWLEALGLPHSSAAHHLVGSGQACLFAWGQWHALAIHELLQQRVVNHVASLLKIAAGQTPQQAFIGRIHHDDWQPEARE